MTQDLHIHTVFSRHDGAVSKEQTPEMVKFCGHADIIGISDHFEDIHDKWDEYEEKLRSMDLRIGCEIDGFRWVEKALAKNVDYYIYHCRDAEEEYEGAKKLIQSGKPLIIAHPNFLNTNLDQVPEEAYIEINNRYVWRTDWEKDFRPYINKFKWVISSDAHQPNWLNQNIARKIADNLGIKESLIFNK
jgi:histidinol phosphatase-like PHP family hydrolase